jgi:GDP-L-fucose synthase
MIGEVVGYQGEIVYDSSKPDGTPRKLVDTSKINGLGWRAGIPLPEGIKSTYQWFLENEA